MNLGAAPKEAYTLKPAMPQDLLLIRNKRLQQGACRPGCEQPRSRLPVVCRRFTGLVCPPCGPKRPQGAVGEAPESHLNQWETVSHP